MIIWKQTSNFETHLHTFEGPLKVGWVEFALLDICNWKWDANLELVTHSKGLELICRPEDYKKDEETTQLVVFIKQMGEIHVPPRDRWGPKDRIIKDVSLFLEGFSEYHHFWDFSETEGHKSLNIGDFTLPQMLYAETS